jgi:hypothetical protein
MRNSGQGLRPKIMGNELGERSLNVEGEGRVP